MHPHLRYIVIPAHVLWLVSLFMVDWKVAFVLPIALLLWIIIGGLGVEIGYHRILSHSHFTVTRLVQKFLCMIGIFGMQGSPLFWRAMHVGYHHAYPDTKRDFHSPVNGGYFNAYIGYINNLDKLRFIGCKNLLDDPFYLNTQKYYNLIFWIPVLLSSLLAPQLAVALLTAMVLCFHQTALVNALCHSDHGYVNFETNDLSKNIKWLSYLTFGLALHNNHHKFPGAADFAIKDDEHDVGFALAKLLQMKERT